MRTLYALAVAICTLTLGAQTTVSPEPAASSGKLEFVVYFSRHGVRTPLTANSSLNNLSADAWPEWGIPLGNMTAHGEVLMKEIGAWDKDYFTRKGLLSADSCAQAGRFYFWADNMQRDIEGARLFSRQMFPGCEVPVHYVSEQTLGKDAKGKDVKDPLFSPASTPLAAGMRAVDRTFAAAAVGGRIGNDPRTLYSSHLQEMEVMQRILLGCGATGICPDGGKTAKRMLLEPIPQPAPPAAPRDRLSELTAVAGQMGTVAESFYLEYVDGMEMKNVAWGRIDLPTIMRLMAVRSQSIDITQRTPYTARAHASNLLSLMEHSMEQAVSGKAVSGAMGKAGDKGLVLLGHDSDIVAMGGTLNMMWAVPGYAPDDTPPGTALVFEVWRDAAGKRTVRTWLLTETPEKMRAATPLTADAPPDRTAVFVPGCSTAEPGYPCDWDAFRKVVRGAIDPAFVQASRK